MAIFIFIDFSFELNISNNMLQKINFPSVSLEDSILRQSELKEKEYANFSLESAKLSKSQILQQSAMNMISQASRTMQNVLILFN